MKTYLSNSKPTLFWRIFFLHAVAIMCVVGLVGMWVVDQYKEAIWQKTLRDLEEKVRFVTPIACKILLNQDRLSYEQILKNMASTAKIRISVIDSHGAVITDSHREIASRRADYLLRPEITQSLANRMGVSFRYNPLAGKNLLYVARTVHNNGAQEQVGLVRAAMSEEVVRAQMTQLMRWVMLLSLSLGLILLSVSYLLIQRVTDPLEELTALCDQLSRGNLSLKFPKNRRDEFGDVTKTLETMASLIEQKIDFMQHERAMFESMMWAIRDPIICVSTAGQLLFWNRSLLQVLETTSLAKLEYDQALAQCPWIVDVIARALSGNQPESDEIEVQPAANSEERRTYFVSTCAFTTSDESSPEGVVILLRDLTYQRQLEQMRRDFVVNVSHEIKTPLTSIQGYLELLRASPDMAESLRERYLNKVDTNAHRLTHLVKDVLTLERVENAVKPNRSTSVSWSEVLKSLGPGYLERAAEKEIDLRIELLAHAQAFHCDLESAQLILDNLVFNALRYTPAGGKITLQETVSSRHDTKIVTLQVCDTGIGISEMNQNKIFLRFFRVDANRSREDGGTGLGLAIVKHTVTNLGGRISVQSKLGEGSCFSVSFPVITKPNQLRFA